MRYQVTLFFLFNYYLYLHSVFQETLFVLLYFLNVIRINKQPVCAIFGDCYRHSQAVCGWGGSIVVICRPLSCLIGAHSVMGMSLSLSLSHTTLFYPKNIQSGHYIENKMGLTKEYLERPHQGISAMWGRYLESGEYSDFLVTCANREFHVHRLVICPRSSYFRLMCKDNFKEGITQKLELVDEDPDVFQSVLTFLYTGIYETCKITGSEEIGNSSPLGCLYIPRYMF